MFSSLHVCHITYSPHFLTNEDPSTFKQEIVQFIFLKTSLFILTQSSTPQLWSRRQWEMILGWVLSVSTISETRFSLPGPRLILLKARFCFCDNLICPLRGQLQSTSARIKRWCRFIWVRCCSGGLAWPGVPPIHICIIARSRSLPPGSFSQYNYSKIDRTRDLLHITDTTICSISS